MIIIPSLGRAGAERVAASLSIGLARSHAVWIVIWDSANPAYEYGGTLIQLPFEGTGSGNVLAKGNRQYHRLKKIKALKKEYQINISISFLEQANLLNVMSRQQDKIIISMRSYMFGMTNLMPFSFGLEPKVKAGFYRKADGLVMPSEQLKALYGNQHGMLDKIEVIHNVCDTDKITQQAQQPIEDRYAKLSEHPVVITAGKMKIDKGPFHLMRSVQPVMKHNPNIRFVVLGAITDMKSELSTYATTLGLRVYWADEHDPTAPIETDYDLYYLGAKNNPFQFLQRAKLFVFPSLYEGFPNALLEAMACKVPVVASDCLTGAREMLDPDAGNWLEAMTQNQDAPYGLLTPRLEVERPDPQDPFSPAETAFHQAINRLLSDQELWLTYSQAARQRSEQFPMTQFMQHWETYLATILNN